MHPQAIIDNLTYPDIQNQGNFKLASGFRIHVIQNIQNLFNEGEKNLEAALASLTNKKDMNLGRWRAQSKICYALA